MTQKEQKLFFESVKFDDLASFCAHIEKDENLLKTSFGRFPLLSTLYLYGSKKIIKRFEEKLLPIADFCVLNEPFELYKTFKNKSDKSLRLYAGKQNFVMPIEMLAILHKDAKVKKTFSGEKYNLQKIYDFNEQKTQFEEKKIKISAKPKTIKNIQRSAWVVIPTALVVTCFFIFAVFFGLGTEMFPRKIHSYADIIAVAEGTGCYSLNEDVTIDGENISNFSANLNANGHIIKVKNGKSLFDKLSGTLRNATIEFVENDFSLFESMGIVANENAGTIENVKVICKGGITAEDEVQLSGFVLENNGTISNSNIEIQLQFSSNSGKDVYFSGFAYENNGEISSCKVLQSTINCTDVDASGIAVKNNVDATISNCENNAVIYQNVETKDWSPTLAGIVLTNFGSVENCVNHGNISATNEKEDNENSTILIGGICSINYNNVSHSKNDAELCSSSKTSTVFVGGICAQVIVQENINAGVDGCASIGKITIEKDSNEYYAFGGGIVGYLRGAYNNGVLGYVNNSYSKCDFATAYDVENKNLIGSVFGTIYGVIYSSYPFYQINVYVEVNNTYFLLSSNASKSTGAVHLVTTNTSGETENQFNTSGDLTAQNYHSCSTQQEIENCPVYW